MSKVEISISGMTCGHCAMSITKELNEVSGVTSVAVDHTTGKAVVEKTDSVTNDALSAAIEEAGYQATEFVNA